MSFFNIVPENLFSILSSKNKDIYIDALFVLRKAYKQEMLIRKEDLVSMLISNLEDRMMLLKEEDEEIGEDSNLSSMAHFLLRRLEETGWIEREYAPNSFDEYINLYDYSIKILNTLNEIIDIKSKEYNSYVYSTYSLLKIANEERNSYIYNALWKAYENTNELIDELKSLLNNIRRYHQSLNEQSKINGILDEHFNQFKELIDDKIYHPLKTFDSVPRFKGPIITILKSWLYDNEIISQMVDSAMIRKVYATKDEAENDIIYMMGEIADVYEKIDYLTAEIDRKKAAYTRASVEKMQYLLNTDRSIKGKLIEILKKMPKNENSDIECAMGECANVFPQSYIDEFSLYTKVERKRRVKSEPLKLCKKSDEKEFFKEFEDFKLRVERSFSHKKIMDFMHVKFNGKEELYTKDMKLKDDDEFIMLIFAALKHDDSSSFYSVEFYDNYILVDGYRMPEMKFKRSV